MNLLRYAVVTVGAVAAMASASSSGSGRNPTGPTNTGDDVQLVSSEIELDPGVQALPVFRRGAQNMGCTASSEYVDGGEIMVIKCSDASMIVAQSGRTLIIACDAGSFTKNECEAAALKVIESAG